MLACVVDYGIQLYEAFARTTVDKLAQDSVSFEAFSNELDYKFSLVLEDSIVNDDVVRYLNIEHHELAVKCLCAMVMCHNLILGCTDPEIDHRFEIIDPLDYCQLIMETRDPGTAVLRLLASHYVLNSHNSTYYEWHDGHWQVLDEDTFEISTRDMLPYAAHTEIDSKNDIMRETALEVSDILDLVSKAVDSVFGLDDLKQFIPISDMTCDAWSFPTRTELLNFKLADSQKHTSATYIAEYMNYDVMYEQSKIVNLYLSNLNCHKQQLATSLASWFCAGHKTLCFLKGPAGSGLTTLTKLAQMLLGPYAHAMDYTTVYSADWHKYAQVRTLFVHGNVYDMDAEFWNIIDACPIPNIVIQTHSKSTPFLMSTRYVYNFDFFGRVKKEIPDIISRITTRLQLGHIMGWIFVYYDADDLIAGRLGMKSASPFFSILDTFLASAPGDSKSL